MEKLTVTMTTLSSLTGLPVELADDSDMPEHCSLVAYVQQLRRCLSWDPLQGSEGREKQVFVEALTEIAALPLDSISMEIRRLLVVALPRSSGYQQGSRGDSNDGALTADIDIETDTGTSAATAEAGAEAEAEAQQQLENVIAALSTRDVLVKCKAANAVGSLCISRVAGQQLLAHHGARILSSIAKMATCKNQWAQGDAFFVLGWIVVIAADDTLASIAQLLPSVLRSLHRNLKLPNATEDAAGEDTESQDDSAQRSRAALVSSEQASNFRVYALVLLLNFCQRDISALSNQLGALLSMLHDLVSKLLGESCVSSESGNAMLFDPSEYAEVLRLAITLLSVLTDQLEAAAPMLLEMKMLPSLLKLKRALHSADMGELVGEAGVLDLTERLEALIKTLVTSR